jgi:hypothetical protein
MAQSALVASRGPLSPDDHARFDAAFARLLPDNITARPAEVIIVEPDLWIRSPQNLFTVEASIRVVADLSRTWWWGQTETLFVLSTSQRFIVSVLGSFEPNREAFAWMMSSGTLGPGHSWDRRIAPLAAGAALSLERNSFQVTITAEPKEFRPEPKSDAEHERALSMALTEVFAGTSQLDPARWIVPLSGGFDSRALLLLAPNARAYRTITWGTRRALDDPHTDAAVARELARSLQLENRYFETDLSPEPIEKIFHRFLVAGEGRVDHFAGYLDGFAVWKHLYESNVTGIIRGDEGFGWVPVASMLDVVHAVGLSAIRDFAGTNDLIEGTAQTIPSSLVHRTGESAATWRDRLYHQFRIPVILAALNALKSPYVEVAAPLLDARLLALVRTQPDHLRTGKVLFKKIVQAKSPPVRYATRSATADPQEVLASARMSVMIADELSAARPLFGDALISRLLPTKKADPLAELKARAVRVLKTRIKESLPVWMRRAARNTVVKHRLDRNTLAFRAFLISRMVKMLEADARYRNA